MPTIPEKPYILPGQDTTEHSQQLREGVSDQLGEALGLGGQEKVNVTPPIQEPVGPSNLRDLLSLPLHELPHPQINPDDLKPEGLIAPEKRVKVSPSAGFLDILKNRYIGKN